MNQTIKLNESSGFITLGQLLKIIGLIQTGGEAKLFLARSEIFVNHQPEKRRGKKLRPGDEIQINQKDHFFIS